MLILLSNEIHCKCSFESKITLVTLKVKFCNISQVRMPVGGDTAQEQRSVLWHKWKMLSVLTNYLLTQAVIGQQMAQLSNVGLILLLIKHKYIFTL